MSPDGFKRLFWGFLFIFVDFKLCSVNILPDFLGYVLLFLGLGVLRPVHPRFCEAWICAAVLIFFSLGDLVQTQPATVQEGGLTLMKDTTSVPGIIRSILQLILIWHVCSGVRDLAWQFDRPQLARAAITRRNLNVALTLITWLAFLAAIRFPDGMFLLIIALVIFAIVVMCLLMGLMRQASHQLQPRAQAAPMTTGTRIWTGAVLSTAGCTLLVLYLFPDVLGLRLAPFPFEPSVGSPRLNTSQDELNAGYLHHVQVQPANADRENFFGVLELAPPVLTNRRGGGGGSGSSSGGGTAEAYVSNYRTVQVDGDIQQCGLEFRYRLPGHTVSIRDLSAKSQAPSSFSSQQTPGGSDNLFNLADGNLFVVRMNDYGEIESLEQLPVHQHPNTEPLLPVFKRLLPEDPIVQALQPKPKEN